MVKFNLAHIPPGSTVTSAELRLYVLNVALRDLAPANINVHPISQDWQEAAVTWTQRGGGSWSSSGGSYGSSIASVAFSSLSSGSWQSFTIPVGTVQAWVNTPSQNYGLLLKRSSDIDPGQAFRHNKAAFASADHPTAALRPQLVLSYSSPQNVGPVAAIDSPGPRSNTIPRDPYVLTASASDPDGSIAKVAFLADGDVLAEDDTSPYSFRWQHLPASVPSLVARAYDDSGASSDSAAVTLRIQETVYSANMDSNPGWVLGSGWEYGSPSGYYRANNSTDDGDPSAGYTGNNLVGYRFNSTLPKLSSAIAATTAAIDCSNHSDIVLSFYYWLGIGERYNGFRADVAISTNGSTWQTLWSNPNQRNGVGVWRQMVLDISSIADGESTVYIRWTMGPGDSYPFAGWNIDDVLVLGTPPPPTLPDGDGDGLPDAWENTFLSGTGQSSTNDSDQDGRSNIEEYWAGTDPDMKEDALNLAIASLNGAPLISFEAREAGTAHYLHSRYYSIEGCSNISDNVWFGIPSWTNILGEGQTCSFNPPSSKRLYYRLRSWIGE